MNALAAHADEKGGSPLEPGQEVDKAIVLLTDGWQTKGILTADSQASPVDAATAVSFLKKSHVRVFEVLLESWEPKGSQVAG